MPNPPKPKSRRPKPRRARTGNAPGSNQLIYRGPYKLPGSKEQNTLYTLEFKSVLSLTSSGAGVLDAVYNNDPAGYQDWSSAAALWDEYRPLSLLVEFKPNNRYSKTTVITQPLYVVIDRDSVGALSTKNSAVQYESCKIVDLDDPWRMGAKSIGMTGLQTHQWTTTAATVPTYCIKMFGNGFSNTTAYGDVLITLLVQFRGRD
jgi:hypothetical protein